MDLPAASNNFNTNGSLSWVDLVSKPITATIDVLARVSAASVDTYSLTVALIIAQRFQLGEKGKRRVSEAIAGLQQVSGWGSVVSLGFGVESLVRILDRTDEGNCTVALLAALSECYHENHVANTIYEMIVMFDPPKDKRPSVSQWLALVKACSGVLSTTTFPKVAEFYMTLDGKAHVRRQKAKGLGQDCRGWASPRSLAETLLALARVSKGEFKSIEVCGNGNAGWVAAVAQWLFDLHVIIQAKDGHVLFRSCAQDVDAQVKVRYTGTIQSEESRDSSKGIYPAELMVATRTFYLKDVSKLMPTPQDAVNYFHVSGRVEWANCLTATFGKDFSDLTKVKQTLGKVIGCAARFLKGCIDCEPCIADENYLISFLQLYSAESSGIGLVEVIVKYFPEIANIKLHMVDMQKIRTAREAATEYEGHIENLRRLCCCPICTPVDEDVLREQALENYRPFCYVVIAETITVLGQTLSNTDIRGNLLPSRIGIELAYDLQLSLITKEVRKAPESEELEMLSEKFGSIANTVGALVARSTGFSRLQQCLSLFSRGSARPTGHAHICALSDAGICAFMNSLCDPATDQERTYRVTVMAGRIEKDERPYDLIADLHTRDDVDMSRYEITTMPDIIERASKTTKIALKIREGLKSLEAAFELQDDTGKAWFDFGPAMLNIMTSQARGRVPCQRHQCRTLSAVWRKAPDDLFRITQLEDKEVIWCNLGSEIERCALITAADALRTESFDQYDAALHSSADVPDDPYFTILQGRNCLDCCLRHAIKDAYLEVLIIADMEIKPPN